MVLVATMIPPFPAGRLANTEYAQFADPAHTAMTPFGRFVHIPEFPDRGDAHQLFGAVGSDAWSMWTLACKLCDSHGISWVKITGHDDNTLDCFLRTTGPWQVSYETMLRHALSSQLQPPQDVVCEPVVPASARELAVTQRDPRLMRSAYHRASDARLGGFLVYALLDGVVCGATGWFQVDGVARFRYLHTLPEYRRRGVASALVTYVVASATADGCEAVALFCDHEETISLYQRLGFIRAGVYWKVSHRRP